MTAAEWTASGCCWASLAPCGLRWLRVAQREHYLPGATSRFALRWWVRTRWNLPLAALALVALGFVWPFPLVAIAVAVVVTGGPVGLSIRGRTARLAWTRRLRTLALAWLALEAGVIAAGIELGRAAFFAAVAAAFVPLVLDLACLLLLPVERWVASRYVAQAATRLRSVAPRIVGITGSFGKTSTKNYVAHLLAGRMSVVATPASFNNRAGLARAVNEHLVPGTQVFVAEMGTYAKGEIAELCEWCPPEIAVITAIGPVHLERFGSEDRILEAKSEITETARTVVLNIDDARLATFAQRLGGRETAPRVLRCSATDRAADVCVVARDAVFDVYALDEPVVAGVKITPGVQPTNVACALGVCVALGLTAKDAAGGLGSLPSVPHRLSVGTAPSGVVVIDDTFNSNPAGSRAALGVLAASAHGRRVVVTPGMVELGPRQASENRAFAQASLEVATDLVVVGQTNRSALRVDGDRTILVRTREDAVRWVREHLVSGDAVLYENDLPDHYP